MTDTTIRRLTAAAVLLVAMIAAVVSFVHIEHLAVTHGQTPLAAFLLPLSIDGTVVAASMVMLQAARASIPTPWLARLMLGLAVTATLAANVAYGWPAGPWWSLLSGWPAMAFIGCAEMALGMVRRATRKATRGLPAGAVPSTVIEAAKVSMQATVEAGNPLSVNQLARQFSLTRAQATKVRQAVLAEANGQGQTQQLTST